MKIAIIGATGLVGRTMLETLARFGFSDNEFILAGSQRSIGKEVETVGGKRTQAVSVETALALRPDVALFSCGGAASLEYAPRFVEIGVFVIDNSSAWRMASDVPLVVPEVNPHAIDGSQRLIANPNCSTIQLVVALAPLARAFGLKRAVVTTFQSVSGTGQKGVARLLAERAANGAAPTSPQTPDAGPIYPYPIDLNVIPQCDGFLPDGYTREERKIIDESRKILGLSTLNITATCVRVPVTAGHSESVNLELEQDFTIAEIREILSRAEGLRIIDAPEQERYPTPGPLAFETTDDVLVGRIRKDESVKNGLHLWIVADNLRKGAATNAIQILDLLLKKGLLANGVGV